MPGLCSSLSGHAVPNPGTSPWTRYSSVLGNIMPRSRRAAARLAGTNTVPSLSHLQGNTMGFSFIPCHWDSPLKTV